MIFFMAMPFVIGFMNFVVPLQLGVRDVAFPTMNNVSFWLTASGALLVNLSLFIGEFARTGWLAFPPLEREGLLARRRRRLLPRRAADIRASARCSPAVNFVTTILKIRAPGHELSAHAGVLLDRARLQPADHRRLPGADRRPWRC